MFRIPRSRWFDPDHLERTAAFFERYGAKTIVIARFVPIVRTFAPFVAGAGRMPYRRFVVYNLAGAVAWVGLCVSTGYFFGNLPFVKENFGLVVFFIIVASLLPAVAEWFRCRRKPVPTAALDSEVAGAR